MISLHCYYELLDINILNMSQVTKISYCKQMALSLNYKDGDPKNRDKLTKREKAMIVDEVPDLLEYLSFVLFPGEAVSGPFSEYAPFKDFINLRGRFAEL